MNKLRNLISRLAVSAVTVAASFAFFNNDNVYADSNQRIIVSLGDSYSSGEGIPPFYGQDDIDSKLLDYQMNGISHYPDDVNDWLAHRSRGAWSGKLYLMDDNGQKVIMSENRNTNWFFAAASGAEIRHINENMQKIKVKRAVVDSRFSIPLQSEIFKKIEKGKVDYVTMTISGNDIGFANIMTDEVVASIEDKVINGNIRSISMVLRNNKAQSTICVNQVTEELEKKYQNFDSTVKKDLKKVYRDIYTLSGEQAKIIVAGYPCLLDKNAKLFTSEAREQVNKYTSMFNKKIEDTVRECRRDENIDIFFTSVEEKFKDHGAYAKIPEDPKEVTDLSKGPYINSIYVTPREQDYETGIFGISSYSLHPNYKGAEAYASVVQEKLNLLDETGIISGRVYNKYSGGTKINFINAKTSEYFSVEADDDGYYEFYGAPGEYTVEVVSGNQKFKLLEPGTDEELIVKNELRKHRRNLDININRKSLYGKGNLEFGGYSWRIVSEDYSSMTLLMNDIIDLKTFNDKYEPVNWEYSSIRKYLNDDFYNTFSKKDREQILTTNVVNNTKINGVTSGNDTSDKVFLLSYDEAVKYFDSESDRTAYYNGNNCGWWLRSSGGGSREHYLAAYVSSKGDAVASGYYVSNNSRNENCKLGVRPVIRIKIPDEKMKPIEIGGRKWKIIDENENAYMVMSEEMICQRAYHYAEVPITWEDSSIRKYLNTEFYDTFNSYEKSMIITTKVDNHTTNAFNISGGNDTYDNVFLLSVDEVMSCLKETDLAVWKNNKKITWWLRTPGRDTSYAALVSLNGAIDPLGGLVDYYNSSLSGGIRPAMWISKDFSSGASADFKTTEFGGYTWRILEETSGSMTVIMDNIYEMRDFSSDADSVSWKDSAVREYLNNDFYNLFSESDKNQIMEFNIKDSESDDSSNTSDRVVLLSSEEAENYLSSDNSRIARYNGKKSNWWLRNGNTYINSNGELIKNDSSISGKTELGVRPVLKLKLYGERSVPVEMGGIQWKVISEKEDAYLVVSEDLVCQRAYNRTMTDITWEDCTIRKYLNGTFMKNFGEYEKSMIFETEVINDTLNEFGISGGNNTIDKVFLLSLDEVKKYLPDEYLIAKCDGSYCTWWLRTPGSSAETAAVVSLDGKISASGGTVEFYNDKSGGIRPAMWISKEYDPFRTTDYKTIEFGGRSWRILEDNDDNMLVISEKIISKKFYETIWETSSIRRYLNKELYSSFTEEEQERIIETTVVNDENPIWGTEGGRPTTDKLFLLSVDEAGKYFFTSTDRMAYYDEEEEPGWWWLRTPGDCSDCKTDVLGSGIINIEGTRGTSDFYPGGVRPAMYIKK